MATAKKNKVDGVKEFIEHLKDIRNLGQELLNGQHELQLRSKSTLDRLIAHLSHAHDIGDHASGHAREEVKEITHIGGIPLGKKISRSKDEEEAASLSPTDADINTLTEMVELAYDDFADMDVKELKETHSDTVIRALGVKMGLNVTPTDPEVIDFKFIGQLKGLVVNQVKKKNAVAEADEEAKKLTESKKEETSKAAAADKKEEKK